MDGSVPKEILQPTEADTEQMHEKVKTNLRIVGHDKDTQPETEKPIPLTEDLKQLGVNAMHIAGVNYHELLTGEGERAKVRASDNKSVVSKIRDQFLRKKAA